MLSSLGLRHEGRHHSGIGNYSVTAYLHCRTRTRVQNQTRIPVLCRNREKGSETESVKCENFYIVQRSHWVLNLYPTVYLSHNNKNSKELWSEYHFGHEILPQWHFLRTSHVAKNTTIFKELLFELHCNKWRYSYFTNFILFFGLNG